MEALATARGPAIWRTLEWAVVVAAALFVVLGTRPELSKGDSANSPADAIRDAIEECEHDIAADGQRFVMFKTEVAGDYKLILVQNWFEELKRLVPN